MSGGYPQVPVPDGKPQLINRFNVVSQTFDKEKSHNGWSPIVTVNAGSKNEQKTSFGESLHSASNTLTSTNYINDLNLAKLSEHTQSQIKTSRPSQSISIFTCSWLTSCHPLPSPNRFPPNPVLLGGLQQHGLMVKLCLSALLSVHLGHSSASKELKLSRKKAEFFPNPLSTSLSFHFCPSDFLLLSLSAAQFYLHLPIS